MQIVGLQIDRPFFRGALLQKGRSGVKICALQSASLTEPEHVKQLYKGKFTGRLVSGLSSKDLMLRPMALNIGNTRHVEAAFVFQSEGVTHLNPADIISIPHAIKKSAGKVEALLFTASREALKLHVEEFEKLQANLDCVSTYGLALVHYIKWKAPDLSDAFIVDLGSNEWTCVLMEKGELKKSHALHSGTEGLLTALWEDRKRIPSLKEIERVAKQMDLRQIESNLSLNLSAKLSEMRQGLGKTLFSFYRTSNPQPIVFTGQVNVFGHLREYLIESFKEAVSKEYDEDLDLEERKYGIPIGLALEQTGSSLQLLTQEFFPKKNWQRAGSCALILVLLSLCLSVFLLYIGLYVIDARKRAMIASAQGMFALWDPQWEAKLLQKEDMALEQWIAHVKAHDQEYLYILDVPRVAEVLAWLSQHPLLQAFKTENDPLEMMSLHYQLVGYPKIGSSQNQYRAKVDLQFRIKSPMNARRFHDILLQGDEIIDPSSEVSWEAMNDSYQTSFFLKHLMSPYVP